MYMYVMHVSTDTLFIIYCLQSKVPCKSPCLGWISLRGATGICIFEGTMDKELFAVILDKTLVPYLHNFETHRFILSWLPFISGIYQWVLLGCWSLREGSVREWCICSTDEDVF